MSDEQREPYLTRKMSRKALGKTTENRPPSPLLRMGITAPLEETPYLIAQGMPPVPLAGIRISIGRHSECDLILPHVSISRRHAVIKSRGKVTVLEDGGSRNGTFVNGKRVKKTQVLHPNDRVSLGPYTFEILGGRPGTGRLPALSGRIEDTPLLEVIQGIEFQRKTCFLRVELGGLKGWLSTWEGKPIEARWSDLVEEAAVLALLRLTQGTFALTNEEPPSRKSTFVVPLKRLLFQAMRSDDDDFDSMRTQRF